MKLTNEALDFLGRRYPDCQIEYFFQFKGAPSQNWVMAKIEGLDKFVSLSILDGCKSCWFGDAAHIKKLIREKQYEGMPDGYYDIEKIEITNPT